MKKLLVALFLFSVLAPVHAEDWGGLFGIEPGDVGGLIAQAEAQRAQAEADRLSRHATKLRMGLVVERRHDEACTLAAVAKNMGITLDPSIPAPAVVYESLAEGWEFGSAYVGEHGIKAKIPSFTNGYYPKANTIFITDGRFSNLRTSVDQSVAAEMARFLTVKYKGVTDAAALKAAGDATSAWYGREFEKNPVCGS